MEKKGGKSSYQWGKFPFLSPSREGRCYARGGKGKGSKAGPGVKRGNAFELGKVGNKKKEIPARILL